jgi:thioredoxin reductase
MCTVCDESELGFLIQLTLQILSKSTRTHTLLLLCLIHTNTHMPHTSAPQVDGYMQTSNPDIYAIGDLAAFPLKMGGDKLVRQVSIFSLRETL